MYRNVDGRDTHADDTLDVSIAQVLSRQVIVVQSPDKELFEQAIFILTDGAVEKGVTDEMLLKQANLAIRGAGKRPAVKKLSMYGPVWAAAGAAVTGVAWLITAFL